MTDHERFIQAAADAAEAAGDDARFDTMWRLLLIAKQIEEAARQQAETHSILATDALRQQLIRSHILALEAERECWKARTVAVVNGRAQP